MPWIVKLKLFVKTIKWSGGKYEYWFVKDSGSQVDSSGDNSNWSQMLCFSPSIDYWSIQADDPTCPAQQPPDEDLQAVCLWKHLTVSYEDQKFDRAGFVNSKKLLNHCENFSPDSLLSNHLTQPLPLVEVRPSAPILPSERDDLQRLKEAFDLIRPVLRQSFLLSLLSFVFLFYLLMVAGSVLLLILSIWLKWGFLKYITHKTAFFSISTTVFQYT